MFLNFDLKLKILLIFLLVVSACTFVWWITSTVIPVARAEISYQLNGLLSAVIQSTDIKDLVFPGLVFSYQQESSTYPNAGIKIPAIYLEEPIVFNVNANVEREYNKALKRGVAHAMTSSYPGSGGLGYYFAHSSSANDISQLSAVFYLLGKLKTGDEIQLWKDGRNYNYTVNQLKITSPDDVGFLLADYSKETIVLQTCWPPGSSAKRLLVFADRLD